MRKLLLPLFFSACTIDANLDVQCTSDCEDSRGQCYDQCDTDCANPGDDQDQSCDTDCRRTCDDDYDSCTVTCTGNG
jgi:hypothetical protein